MIIIIRHAEGCGIPKMWYHDSKCQKHHVLGGKIVHNRRNTCSVSLVLS